MSVYQVLTLAWIITTAVPLNIIQMEWTLLVFLGYLCSNPLKKAFRDVSQIYHPSQPLHFTSYVTSSLLHLPPYPSPQTIHIRAQLVSEKVRLLYPFLNSGPWHLSHCNLHLHIFYHLLVSPPQLTFWHCWYKHNTLDHLP